MRTAHAATMRSLLVMLLCVGALGCTRHLRESPPPTAAALRAKLHARQERLRGLDLETRTESALGGTRARGTVLILAARDGRLRFEIEVSLRGTVAALVADEERYAFVDLEHGRFERGPACPENIAALLQLPLSPAEVAAMLLADTAIGAEGRLLGSGWDASLGAERLDLEGAPARDGARLVQRVFLRRMDREYVVVRIEGARLPAGAAPAAPPQPAYTVVYDDFVRAGGLLLPDRIRFAPPGRRLQDGVDIAIRARRINPPLTPQAFSLDPPPGFEAIETGCPRAP